MSVSKNVSEPVGNVEKSGERSDLSVDEPDGHDAEPLGRVQQAPSRSFPSRVVLEGHPFEPRERVPHVRFVVDRE